jgi:hypothetical protein
MRIAGTIISQRSVSGEIEMFMAVLSGRFCGFQEQTSLSPHIHKALQQKKAIPENNLWLLKGPDYRQQHYNRAQGKDSPVRRRKETP